MIDNYIDRKISEKLVEDNKKRERPSSGRLSASMLGQPLQWQILQTMGIPKKELDDYTLRKFLRGNQVEEWIVGYLDPIEKQKFVEYKGCVGYVDAICDTKDWDFKNGIIPVEVKSVTNMKFKRIEKQGADHSHLLQGAFYALAMGAEKFAILYVASDDYRVHLAEYEVKDYKEEINAVISDFEAQKAKNSVPAFIPKEKWQGDLKYNSYPDWANLTQEERDIKLLSYKK